MCLEGTKFLGLDPNLVNKFSENFMKIVPEGLSLKTEGATGRSRLAAKTGLAGLENRLKSSLFWRFCPGGKTFR
jgi:hypothetical protein